MNEYTNEEDLPVWAILIGGAAAIGIILWQRGLYAYNRWLD